MKKLIYLLLLLVMVSPVMAADQDTTYTVDLRTWIRNYLGGDATDGFWTDGIIDDYMQIGCDEYASLGGIPKRDTIVTSTGEDEYALNSDFIHVRGVTRYDGETKRQRALKYRSVRAVDGVTKAIGEDNDRSHPEFYTITGESTSEGYYLIIDPPEEEGDRDTLIVYYYAQATELSGDSTITNIPYSGKNFVVFHAVKSAMIMNRESTERIAMIDKMYQLQLTLMREQSDMDFNLPTK